MILNKAGVFIGQVSWVLLLNGCLSVLITEKFDGGRKFIFNAKISVINAFETDGVGVEKDFIVEIIMATSGKTGSRQLTMMQIHENNNSFTLNFNPPFDKSLEYSIDASAIIME